mmetsp:Transcript_23786/g.34703  ORF Transcript_23786/g.34703 Transcript_23786/m.34703 type:complete len:624 (-) Transcript_23786:170-2041(-)|eukprot:CAMPEP_0195516870 /NCGR_PEP_ID=MMETSP0794_2-20130614/8877_1 /TAXON_ID=515487 /ORGANISM="Stephanopyxis turris, Strain CCMP 815" /LENGTH=623 /DNA_ID=CAMNT_0040645573 /DNA_START=184 /DNA_END=2055 /DNA_ORIENTATION=+
MRVASLRGEIPTHGDGPLLMSPLPLRLRKHAPHDLPARPSPLSLSTLRPEGSGSRSSKKSNKLKLPSLNPFSAQDGQESETQHTLETQFEFLAKLENAIYGTVLKAERRSDGKLVAIKVLDKQRIRKRVSVTNIPVFENAQVELSVLQKASDAPHPNVLRSLAAEGTHADVLHDETSIYSITPFCDKGELYHAIRSHPSGSLPVKEATRLFAQIVRGVHHLHSRLGYVHNDISPENVLLRSMERRVGSTVPTLEVIPVLADFGLATKIGQPAPRVPGKVGYQAPEVLYAGTRRGTFRVADAASDVFSLGVLFFVMLTGVLPYDQPHKSDPKYATLQEGSELYAAAIQSWDNAPCDQLATRHPELLELICSMTRHVASERPTLPAVLTTLEGPREKLMEPAPSAKLSSPMAKPRRLRRQSLSQSLEPHRGRIRRSRRSATQRTRSTASKSQGFPDDFPFRLDELDDLSELPSTLNSGSRSADEDEQDEPRARSMLNRSLDSNDVERAAARRRAFAFRGLEDAVPVGTSPSTVTELTLLAQKRMEGNTGEDASEVFSFGDAASRALLSSSCSTMSNSSSGSNNKKQHATERRREKRKNKKVKSTKKRAKAKTPMSSLLKHALRQR